MNGNIFKEQSTGEKVIAILGGSFDPPTIAHIQVAAEIYNNFSIDEVWIISLW